MKVYPETKIFIIAPGNIHSGGPELVHQLASQLLKMNYKVFMFYLPANTDFDPRDPVHPLYKKYHIPFVRKIEMNEKNIIIVPESSSLNLYISDKLRRIMWWMSVDNYINNLCNILKKFKLNPLNSTVPKFFYFDKNDSDIEHWVQSEYAEIFIKKNGIADDKIYSVRDYLNEAFLNRSINIDLSKKENIVAFNPLKGFEFTQKLVKAAPEIDWHPIRNMTPEQVQQLLAKSKVYIDFGNHPGRDRIPREAAVSGCCIITGKRGAAANDKDIDIDDSFKFDDTNENVPKIINKIKEIFNNFKSHYKEQQNYRDQIMREPKDFEHEVRAAFGYEEAANRPKRAAVIPALSSENLKIIQTLINDTTNYSTLFVVDDRLAYRKGVNVKSEIITSKERTNYLSIGEIFLPLISKADAAFLYREGRIEKFITCRSTQEKISQAKTFIHEIGASEKDLVILND